MAEDKKPPKLASKGSKSGASTPSQPSKSTKDGPAKKPPPKLPAQSAKGTPQKQAPKLNQQNPQAKSDSPAKTNGSTKQTPKASAPKASDKKAAEDSQQKPAPQKRPAAPRPVAGNQEQNRKRPSIAPKDSSASTPKQGAPDGKSTARKPSMAPRKPSMKPDGNGGRPSIAPKESSTSTPKQGNTDGKSTARKPSIAPRKPSMKPDGDSKRPSIVPKGSSAQVQKNPAEDSKAAPRRPSMAPKKSTTQPSTKKTPQAEKQPQSDRTEDTPAHRLNEENRNLKDILSESQCADLTILIANVTERMRQSIEKAFDAKAGLKLINQAKEGQDNFANIDYDPATVDVGAYDKERKVQTEQEKELSKPQVQELKKASLDWFDDWRQVVIQRVGEVVNSKKIAEKQKDDVATSDAKESPVEPQQRSQKISTNGKTGEYAPPKLEDLFPRVRTPLTKLPIAQRVLVLHSILLLLLSLEHYNAASRVLLLYLASSLKVGLSSLRADEEQTAQGLLEAAKQMTAEQEAGKKKQESAESRKWKIRLASAAGAAIIGYTGGMAAPMVAAGVGSVMGELGLGSTAAAGYLGSVAGNTAIVGSLFGAYGGRMTGQIMSNISAEVEDFAFLPVHGERKDVGESLDAANDKRRLRVVVAISGWLLEKEEVVSPWRVLKPSAEIFALRFELEALMNLGQSFDTMLSSAAYGYAQSALAKRTVFSELMSSMWPIALVKVARVVDNPFSVAKNRADKAGEVLAEALMNRAQGERPVTLIGYSLGARVIWSCLTTLAKKRGFGFVESAVMMGSPIPSDLNTWREMRSTVTGRLINVYSENDYLLAFLYRSASLQYGVAGLMPVAGLSGVENVDVSEMVSGHLRYRHLVGSILDKIRFEDIDKDEVAKESKAYEALVEEEKKNTYEKQFRAGAENLYDEYGQRLGLPKDGKKYVSQKEEDVSDEQANKQASNMEKQVHDKTQKGLMQWAVEQLYITPSGDAKKEASDQEKDTEKTGKGAEKTAEKSYYDRALEATYLKRSGGPEGEAAAKDKASEAEKSAKSDNQGSYLSSAASYIPSGYLPSFGGSTEKPQEKAPKKLSEQPKRPSTLNKTQSKSRASQPQVKRTDSTPKGTGGNGKEGLTKDGKEEAKKDGKEGPRRDGKEGPEKYGKEAQKKNGKEGPQKDGKQVPKKDGQEAPKQAQDGGAEPPKKATPAGKNGQADSAAGSTPNGKAPGAQPEAPKSFSERFQASRQKAVTDASENPWDYVETGKKGWDNVQKGWGALKQGRQDVDDMTKTAKDAKDTAEGYGSYLPSWGSSKSKEDPKKDSEDKKPDDTKEEPKEKSKDGKNESKEDSKDAKDNGKQDSAEDQTQKDSSKGKPEESSGYTSYMPSFGFGSSGEKSAEDSKKEDPPKESKTEDKDDEKASDKKKPEDNKDDKHSALKDVAKESESKSQDDSKDAAKNKDEPQAKDDPPKKRYPWEVAMDQGQDVDPQKAEACQQEYSSYNPAGYMPSLGWGGSEDKGKQDQSESKDAKEDDHKPTKSPKGGLMSDSDIYPEDSISSPEKGRRRTRSKQPKEKKDSISESGPGEESSKQSQGNGKDDEGGKKQSDDPSKDEGSRKESDDPSKDDEKEEPKKKYPWEVAMEEGRDVQAEQASKNSGLSSYMPSFGGGDGGWTG